MTKSRTSARPICHACNRPFDPRSAGATSTMGPTCAKRGTQGFDRGNDWQLAFALPEELVLSAAHRSASTSPRPPQRQIPARFSGRHDQAKLAFDELFREFCLIGVLLTGERADQAERELWTRPMEAYSLTDPALTWLEPEHDLTLLIEPNGRTAYHRRVINDVATLLELDCARSATARAHVDTIVAYVTDLRTFSQEQDAIQLSFF